jgi:group I intron endonuclease
MEYNIEDKGKSGIYCIKNKKTNKIYVGKAKCIHTRIKEHATRLNKKNKDENIHLIHAWHKYGRDEFIYYVLEYLDFDENLLKERELYWIVETNALSREVGYNLRLDSETGLICSDETRKRLSESQKKRWSNLEARKELGEKIKDRWLDEERLSRMKNSLSISRSRYYILQQTKDGEIVKLWNTMKQLLDSNPEYKRHNIYAVCSGEKPSMYGFTWKKIPKQ